MRKLASFDDPAMAQALDARLSSANIPTIVRSAESGSQAVWIVSEQDLPAAELLLRSFLSDAGSRAAAAPGRTRPRLWEEAKNAPVTAVLLVVCVIVAAYTELGANRPRVELFTISHSGAGDLTWSAWDDLRAGQLWRLFTPVLLHFHVFHILFNAFWLRDLGVPTERVQGSLQYGLFLLWSAAVSNVAQLVFEHSPNFGGLSGVVYALVGYLWARGRADPASGIQLPNAWLIMFVIWMALGFTGLLNGLLGGGIANYCHLVGFAAGTLYGYIAALIARATRERR
jgi:GlpG protein